MNNELTNNLSEIKYALPSKNLVWIIHILAGLFFVAIGAIYYSFKDKEEKDVPINLKTIDQAVYTILLILGGLMLLWHGHLFVADKGLISKIFGN